jgi:hypothetical protein
MPTYIKKADGTALFLPGIGRVRDGRRVVVSARIAEACSGSLVLAELVDPPAAPAPPKAVTPPPLPKPAPAPEPDPAPEPEPVAEEPMSLIEGYDDMNVHEATDALEKLEFEEDLLEMQAYEAANKNRKTVLAVIADLLEDID